MEVPAQVSVVPELEALQASVPAGSQAQVSVVPELEVLQASVPAGSQALEFPGFGELLERASEMQDLGSLTG